MSRIIDVDPVSGITSTFDYHAPTDTVILGYHQDIEPIIEANKRRKLNIDKNSIAMSSMICYTLTSHAGNAPGGLKG